MNKAQQILSESLGIYGIIDDKPCKVKFDKNGNPNINVASLYPSIIGEIDKSCIVNEYEDKGQWIIEVDSLKMKNFKIR